MTVAVSIVIPVYNDENYVALAIESALGQDYENLEIIVVDDGSTDNTPAIVDRYADRCTVVHQPNAGQSAALGVGWARARGELLGYLSSDDLLRAGAISALVDRLQMSDALVAYPDFGIIDTAGKQTRVVRPPDYDPALLYGEWRCLPCPGALFRRSAYEQAGPWRADLRMVPDYEFWLRVGLLGDFLHVPEVLADFRLHADSTSYSPQSAERCNEPIRVASDLVARELPPRIAQYRRRMQTMAIYRSGIMHGQSGRRGRALMNFCAAAVRDPSTVLSGMGRGCIKAIVGARPFGR